MNGPWITPEEWAALWPDGERSAVLATTPGRCDEHDALALRAVCPDAMTAADRWGHILRHGGGADGWPVLDGAPRARWEAYCREVEDGVTRDHEGGAGPGSTRPATSVFGVCRRCGSQRLTITNRQIRRADARGLACGGVDRPTPRPRRRGHDGVPLVSGLWSHHPHQRLTRPTT